LRANHSPLQFFGLIATVSALAYGVYTDAASARTMVSTTESNGASASLVPGAATSVPEADPRGPVDATRTPVDSGGTSFGQRRGQVAGATAPAKAVPPTPASRSTRVDVGVTPLIGGRHSAGPPANGTAPSATTTATTTATATKPLLPDPSSVDSAGRTPVATRVHGRQGPFAQRKAPPSTASPTLATPPPTTTAAATEVPIARPATQPVATPPTATSPVATGSVATGPVATQPLGAPSAPVSPANRGPRLIQLHASAARWLRPDKNELVPLVTPTHSQPSPRPINQSRGQAAEHLGSAVESTGVLAGDAGLDRGSATAAADSPRSEVPLRPALLARTHAATPPPNPQLLPSVRPVETRPPIGGAAAATGGAVGAVAPSVVSEFAALAVVLATILLGRFSLDRVAWRSALLVSRLERPG
jgi:hypothetical protein